MDTEELTRPEAQRADAADGAQQPEAAAGDGTAGGHTQETAEASAFSSLVTAAAAADVPRPRADSSVRAQRSWRGPRCARGSLRADSRASRETPGTKVAQHSSHP